MNKNNVLPDRPSLLIALALDDLELARQDPNYEINMADWHVPNHAKGTCEVCLAGAVLAKTLRIEKSTDYISLSFTNGNGEKITALDYFRSGYMNEAIDCFVSLKGRFGKRYLKHIGKLKEMPVTQYDENPNQFVKDMDEMRLKLESLGL